MQGDILLYISDRTQCTVSKCEYIEYKDQIHWFKTIKNKQKKKLFMKALAKSGDYQRELVLQ